jgi:hypothetical protein
VDDKYSTALWILEEPVQLNARTYQTQQSSEQFKRLRLAARFMYQSRQTFARQIYVSDAATSKWMDELRDLRSSLIAWRNIPQQKP